MHKLKKFIVSVVLPTLMFANNNIFAYVITYNLGPGWYHPSGREVLNLDNDTVNAYTINNASRAVLNNELFLGMQTFLINNIEGQIGISLNHNSNLKINGNVWQEASPEFDNFNYHYYISHKAIAFKGKFLFTKYGNYLQPYLSASVGVAGNKSYAYNQVAKIPEVVDSYSFKHNNLISYTYTAEAGVQQKLNKNWAIGIGYEFADLGRSKLGAAYAQPNKNVPFLNHLYINQLQFNISYLFYK